MRILSLYAKKPKVKYKSYKGDFKTTACNQK